jgi:CRP/FNR family cyclic AMP-dependent transcriptional regulator
MSIRENRLFKGVGKGFIDQIESIAVRESHGKGVFLFKTGDPANHFYILEEGRICVCADTKGHEVSFIYTPGEFFAWSSLLDRTSYSASAECVIPSRVIKIEKKKLNEVLKKDCLNGLIFYRNFAEIIGGRFLDSYKVKDWFPGAET